MYMLGLGFTEGGKKVRNAAISPEQPGQQKSEERCHESGAGRCLSSSIIEETEDDLLCGQSTWACLNKGQQTDGLVCDVWGETRPHPRPPSSLEVLETSMQVAFSCNPNHHYVTTVPSWPM